MNTPGLRDLQAVLLAAIGSLLLVLSIAGVIWPADYRHRFSEPLLGYDEAIAQIDAAWSARGHTAAFVEEATRVWDAATAYEWPDGYALVAPRDNWILFASALLDGVVHATGLKRDAVLFGQFESFRYERALRRGFGICSQNALGFADLLHRRFGVDVRPVGLYGHVVTRVVLPDGTRVIADPSIGLMLPFSVSDAENNPEQVQAAYAAAGHAALATAYDSAGNVRAPTAGSAPYAPPFWKMTALRWFERTADVLQWVLPAALIAVGCQMRRRGRARNARDPMRRPA